MDHLRHVSLPNVGNHRSGPMSLQYSRNAPNRPGNDTIAPHQHSSQSIRIKVGIPLLILPLLCAAYAEVNGESKRLLKVPSIIQISFIHCWILIIFHLPMTVHMSSRGAFVSTSRYVAIAAFDDRLRNEHQLRRHGNGRPRPPLRPGIQSHSQANRQRCTQFI